MRVNRKGSFINLQPKGLHRHKQSIYFQSLSPTGLCQELVAFLYLTYGPHLSFLLYYFWSHKRGLIWLLGIGFKGGFLTRIYVGGAHCHLMITPAERVIELV